MLRIPVLVALELGSAVAWSAPRAPAILEAGSDGPLPSLGRPCITLYQSYEEGADFALRWALKGRV